MKIKSITIQNMHKISEPVKYDLNDVSYFIGPNGAGKSTVLQAIQLALLGYIPGYDKTNAGVFKHSYEGKPLSVILELDSATITRAWTKKGATISSDIIVNPPLFDIKNCLSEIEFPIFNFAEFKDMSANKLKEWFISFLPKEEFDVDWREYLTSELGSREALLTDELMDTVLGIITELEEQGKKGVDLVSALNDQLKLQQSFSKTQITRLQDTINSMIYYQDAEDFDAEQLRSSLTELQSLKDQLIKYQAEQSLIHKTEEQIKMLGLSASSYTEDPEYLTAHNDVIEYADQLSSVKAQVAALESEMSDLKIQQARVGSITSAICPYTKAECAEIAAKLVEIKAQNEEFDEKIKGKQAELAVLTPELTMLDAHLTAANQAESDIMRKYTTASALKKQLPEFPLMNPTSLSAEELQEQIAETQSKLIQIEANNKFNELNATLIKDKYTAENNLEVLKIWVNSTGANGLQTYMMEKPFKTLAENMSSYLSTMFGKESTASFHLEEKANSFSFGIVRGDDYIEFDLLSSGEKCLFTLALMMCLISRSSTELKVILADDILDHLDEENADRMFALIQDAGVQFIMAGVKECKNKEICLTIRDKS